MTDRMGALLRRRSWFFGWAAVCALALPAFAQDKPPMRLLVGFPAGGNVDFVARILADKLRTPLARPLIVENKPGAGSRIAMAELKRLAPDGNTLAVSVDAPFTIFPHTFAKLEFDPQKDFTPIVRVATLDYAIAVAAQHPARNIREFMAWAAKNPKEASYASPGAGSGPSFVGQELARIFKVPLADVPYRGGQAANADVIGGTIAAAVGVLPDVAELHRSGKLRVLGVGGTRRSPLLPDVPTFREQGVDFDADITIGVYGPKSLAPASVDAVARAVVDMLSLPEVQAAFERQGLMPAPLGGEQLGALQNAEMKKWQTLIKSSGYVAQ